MINIQNIFMNIQIYNESISFLLLQPSPNRAGLRKDEEIQAVELTVFIHGNEKPWNNKYNTI